MTFEFNSYCTKISPEARLKWQKIDTSNTTTNCCRASARQLTNLDIPVLCEIRESRTSLSPELYIVEISICVWFCGDDRFPGNRIFFSTNTGENVTNSAGRLCTETRLFFMFV